MDAATDLASIVETVDATRADLAEFRHEMRRELDRTNSRIDGLATKAELQAMRADIYAALHRQTQWMLAGVVTVLLAIYFSR